MVNIINTVNPSDGVGISTQPTLSTSERMRQAIQQQSTVNPTNVTLSGGRSDDNDKDKTDAESGLFFPFVLTPPTLNDPEDDGVPQAEMLPMIVRIPLNGAAKGNPGADASLQASLIGRTDSVTARQEIKTPSAGMPVNRSMQCAHAVLPSVQIRGADAGSPTPLSNGRQSEGDRTASSLGLVTIGTAPPPAPVLTPTARVSVPQPHPSAEPVSSGQSSDANSPLVTLATLQAVPINVSVGAPTSSQSSNAGSSNRRQYEGDRTSNSLAATVVLGQTLALATHTPPTQTSAPAAEVRQQQRADSAAMANEITDAPSPTGELEYRFASWDAEAAVRLTLTETSQPATILSASNERVYQVLQSSLAGNLGRTSTPLMHLAQRDKGNSGDRREAAYRQSNKEDQGETG
jgi:hypothetical protein